jgi:hypothetical protein
MCFLSRLATVRKEPFGSALAASACLRLQAFGDPGEKLRQKRMSQNVIDIARAAFDFGAAAGHLFHHQRSFSDARRASV